MKPVSGGVIAARLGGLLKFFLCFIETVIVPPIV